MIVLSDIDETLCQLMVAAMPRVCRKLGLPPGAVAYRDLKDWSLEGLFVKALVEREVLEVPVALDRVQNALDAVFEDPYTYIGLQPYPGIVGCLKEYWRQDAELRFVTARSPVLRGITLAWLREQFDHVIHEWDLAMGLSGDERIRYIVDIAPVVYLDDKPDTCKQVRDRLPTTTVVMPLRPWSHGS